MPEHEIEGAEVLKDTSDHDAIAHERPAPWATSCSRSTTSPSASAAWWRSTTSTSRSAGARSSA